MLQVDPKKRIPVKKLLSHPWLTLGVMEPVKIRTEIYKSLDTECVSTMAKFHQVEVATMWNYLKEEKYDYHTATYFLLLGKKSRGASLKLYNSAGRFPVSDKIVSGFIFRE